MTERKLTLPIIRVRIFQVWEIVDALNRVVSLRAGRFH